MNLTTEQLKEVEEISELFFSARDISINIGLDADEFALFETFLEGDVYEEEIYQAYHRGRLQTEIALRESIKKAALNGSSPSQTLMQKYSNS